MNMASAVTVIPIWTEATALWTIMARACACHAGAFRKKCSSAGLQWNSISGRWFRMGTYLTSDEQEQFDELQRVYAEYRPACATLWRRMASIRRLHRKPIENLVPEHDGIPTWTIIDLPWMTLPPPRHPQPANACSAALRIRSASRRHDLYG